jgi:beta-glucosidase
MGLAATFSEDDAYLNGKLVALEARQRAIDVVLQPFINMDRDFQFGRGYNTYGEDPMLTGAIGANFIRGVQDQGIMAQAKHFIGYDTDGETVRIDPQTLHEFYLAPFADAIEAGVSSLMCSYNRINGPYACGNPETLQTVLRGQLDFQGFITSDWGATHAADFLHHGLDMEMPGPLPVSWAGPSYFVLNPWRTPSTPDVDKEVALNAEGLPEETHSTETQPASGGAQPNGLKALVASGAITEAEVTHAARRVLFEMNRFGRLDSGVRQIDRTDYSAQIAKIIEKTSGDAAVLLKNENHALPLDPASVKSVALIGPGARQVIAVGYTGEKAVGRPEEMIGPYEALRSLAGSQLDVRLAVGNDMDGTPIPASALSHFGEPGLARRTFRQNAVHIDPDLNFTQASKSSLPANQSIVWSGTLTVPESGLYRIHLQLRGSIGRVHIDKQLVVKNWYNWIHGEVIQPGQDDLLPTTDGLDNMRAAVQLDAGPHQITIEVDPDSSDLPMQVRLNWVTPSQQQKNFNQAVDAARGAQQAIVFAWSRLDPPFSLPGDQDRLIESVAAVNPNTIVVLNLSQPVAMPWLSKVKGVLLMWWPGDQGGLATAKVLLGQVNPGGRLPFTWPRKPTDMPAQDPAHPERTNSGVEGVTTFSEGIFVGYRWLDAHGIDPLYPFGYGLSYTHFQYSQPHLKATDGGGADAIFTLTNAGHTAGDEVAQVYLDAPANPPAGIQFAPRALAGFARLHLSPGESQTVKVHLKPRRFEYWSADRGAWVTLQDGRTVEIGGSSRDLPIKVKLP